MSPTQSSYGSSSGYSPLKIFAGGLVLIVLVFFLFTVGSLWENVDASSIVVKQGAQSGNLTVWTQPGVYWQAFGKVTVYPRRQQYEFEQEVRFNDGGHGTMHGSVQWTMPLDDAHVIALHRAFGSGEAIQTALIQKQVNKALYMTGPMMSSKESYAEKRTYLLNYIEDQIEKGVYRTQTTSVKIKDELTGQEKAATLVEIVKDSNGLPTRQEVSALTEFGIHTFGFAINSLPYDPAVEAQIKAQQQITMDVQTAIADARKAEQNAITVEQNGKADAMKAKWSQEVIKAQAVTEAQQELEVATLDNKRADQYRESTLKIADADSRARKLKMEADGALEAKLATYKSVNETWAAALGAYQGSIVPQTIMGGSAGSGNAALGFMDIITAKAAKDLSLEVTPGRR